MAVTAVLAKAEQFLQCFQDRGALAAKFYRHLDSTMTAPKIGGALVLNQSRVNQEMINCLLGGQEGNASAQTFSIEPCASAGSLVYEGDNISYVYVGSHPDVCEVFQLHFDNLAGDPYADAIASARQKNKERTSMTGFNGLGLHLGNLSRLSAAKSRSLSAENFDGGKGRGGMADEGTGSRAARDLGHGWKVSPSVRIAAGETFTMADIAGPGAIQQIWLTPTGNWRFCILRIYWDGSDTPSVECPIGDFFAVGWGEYAQVTSLPVCVNPGSAFNCYWEMPFREHCRMTISNIAEEEMTLYYQVNYTLTDVPDDAAYFHAQFRRVNPLPYKDVYTIVDGISGRGHYVGTYMAWGATTTAGGARAKSSSIWTATSIPRFAARAPRTTSAAPTTLIPARGITRATSHSPRPTPASIR